MRISSKNEDWLTLKLEWEQEEVLLGEIGSNGFIKSNFSSKMLSMIDILFRDNGFAERLFNSLEVKSAEAFSCLICGMVKHGQGAGANEYYNQMLGMLSNAY